MSRINFKRCKFTGIIIEEYPLLVLNQDVFFFSVIIIIHGSVLFSSGEINLRGLPLKLII